MSVSVVVCQFSPVGSRWLPGAVMDSNGLREESCRIVSPEGGILLFTCCCCCCCCPLVLVLLLIPVAATFARGERVAKTLVGRVACVIAWLAHARGLLPPSERVFPTEVSGWRVPWASSIGSVGRPERMAASLSPLSTASAAIGPTEVPIWVALEGVLLFILCLLLFPSHPFAAIRTQPHPNLKPFSCLGPGGGGPPCFQVRAAFRPLPYSQ